MENPVDVRHSHAQAERHRLGLVSEMNGLRFRFLPRSKSCGGVRNGRTVGEWLGGVGGGLVAMFM